MVRKAWEHSANVDLTEQDIVWIRDVAGWAEAALTRDLGPGPYREGTHASALWYQIKHVQNLVPRRFQIDEDGKRLTDE